MRTKCIFCEFSFTPSIAGRAIVQNIPSLVTLLVKWQLYKKVGVVI